MADLNPEVMHELVRLMNGDVDLDALDDEALLALGAAAHGGRKLLGEVVARLNRRGWTFERIGEHLGVHESTAYRWAQPYLREQPTPVNESPGRTSRDR